MAPGHRLELHSIRRIRVTEYLCWIIAALFMATIATLVADAGSIAGLMPILVIALFAGWSAWRLRGRRRRLRDLHWDELLPVVRRLRGMVFEEAVKTLQAEAERGPEAPPPSQIEESADCRRHRALVRLRPGLWIEVKAKDTFVRFAGASLGPANATGTPEIGAPSLARALARSSLLVLFDGLVVGQGFLSLTIGLVLLVGRLPFVLLSRETGLRRARLRNLALYLGSVVLVLVIVGANSRLAQQRAETLIAAVKSYHGKYARYPGRLEELVPEFVREIPPAKIMLGDCRFNYRPAEAGPILYYTSLPPFGRRVYYFATDRWTFLD